MGGGFKRNGKEVEFLEIKGFVFKRERFSFKFFVFI